MFKIASFSGAPPQTPLGELTTLPIPPSRKGRLAFGNRSFAPLACNFPVFHQMPDMCTVQSIDFLKICPDLCPSSPNDNFDCFRFFSGGSLSCPDMLKI